MGQVYLTEEPDVGPLKYGRISLDTAIVRVLVAQGLLAGLVFPTVTVSGTFQVGTATSGTIDGATPGSTITSNIAGITVDNSSAGTSRAYSGTPTSAGSVANGFSQAAPGYTTKVLAVVVASAATTTPTPTPTPTATFTTQPSISPGSGTAGSTTFTANDGVIANGSFVSRRWLLGTTAIGTGTTVAPSAAGALTLEVTGTGGILATSPAVTVAVAAASYSIFAGSPIGTVVGASVSGSSSVLGYHRTGDAILAISGGNIVTGAFL